MASNEWGSTEVKGLKELNEALKELPERVARNVLRGAAGAGAAVIRKEAQHRAPVYTGPISQGHPPPGTLKKAIRQSQQRQLSSLVQQTFHISVRATTARGKAGVKALGAYYWRFVEFGTSKMAARPFMRPAFEAKKLAAVEAIRAYMAERIPREADKLNKGPRP